MRRETFRFFVSASVLGDEPPGSKPVRRQCGSPWNLRLRHFQAPACRGRAFHSREEMTTVMEALYEQRWFKQPASKRRGWTIMNCYPPLPRRSPHGCTTGKSACILLNWVSQRHGVGFQIQVKRPDVVMLQPQSNRARHYSPHNLIIEDFLTHLFDTSRSDQVAVATSRKVSVRIALR